MNRRVLPLRKPKYAYVEDVENADKAMTTLRYEMYEFDPHDLARRVGVSVACIYAIRSGRTKWPRPNTFFGLLRVLKLQMLLIKGARL